MSQKFAGVKGMNDLLPPQIATWQRVEATARALFACYGYQEIRTPIVEDTALFVRSVGEVTDIVKKEMYTFDDKGGRSITLRPEGTAPAARAYIEHGIANTEPVSRWFYLGPMFRYERMKTGRYRQFYQLGAEAYGSGDASMDVEVIALAWEFFRRLGVPDVVLHLNSLGDGSARPAYVEALKAHFAPLTASMSEDAKQTFERNPMRLLDSKEEGLADPIAKAPAILDFLDEASRKHFEEVQRLLAKLSIPWTLDRRLVRGLDYYTRTTFEFIYQPKSGDSALSTAGTVCGGGRYDGLVHELGGPEKPAVGFAMGLDRLVMLLEAGNAAQVAGPTLFIGTFDGPLREDAVARVMRLRNAGYHVDFDPRGGKLKRQIERAAKVGARYFTTWGEKEVQAGKLEFKALALPDDHPQKTTTVELAGLEAWLALNAPPGKAS
ncbi:MAG: histidine--tRNA ligase [Myxococcales bacterium]|nr:histidine--tRNA ligase [Myxococcales bacterium]